VRWPLRVFIICTYAASVGAVLVTLGGLLGVWPLDVAGIVGVAAGAAGFGVWLCFPAEGGHACLVFQFGARRVHHWHRPPADIVNCRRSVGFHVGRART
jgi:hypothetical protein